MKTVILRAGDAGRDALPLIQKALDEIGEGGTLCFEKGVYPLSAAVELHGKRNIPAGVAVSVRKRNECIRNSVPGVFIL